MIKRYVQFKNFRTLGINEPNNYKLNRIMLNQTSIESCYSMGGIVTLIGLNNAGKSNVIDGLDFISKELDKKDKPDFIFDQELSPEIKLITKDDNVTVTYDFVTKEKTFVFKPGFEVKVHSSQLDSLDLTEEELEFFHVVIDMQESEEEIEFYGNSHADKFATLYNVFSTLLSNGEIDELIGQCKSLPHNVNLIKGLVNYNAIYRTIKDKLIQLSTDLDIKGKNIELEEYCSQDKRLYNSLFRVPNVIRHSDKEQITNADFTMVLSSEKIVPNHFFSVILKILDVSNKQLKNIYTRYLIDRNTGILVDIEDSMNEKLEIISEKFNRLYYGDIKNKYRFRIRVESSRILFYLRENSTSISIDKQSTGFQWFFNFYFSVLSSFELTEGDIVLLDEPATNLHVKSQIELRKLIKEFGFKNNITFLLSTHSPFLVDLAHLDELRVVKKYGQKSSIYNTFTDMDNGFDVTENLIDSLTVEQFRLINSSKKMIFVEGMLDYNYLNTFIQYEKDINISFLPIDGLLQDNKKLRMISERFGESTVLIDVDKAGSIFLEKSQSFQNIKVVQLNSIGKDIKQVEDLFSDEDRKKYLIDKKKVYNSINLKNGNYEFSKETHDNFSALLQELAK